MKNIVFDFGDVLVSTGSLSHTLQKMSQIKNIDEFIEKYDDVIKKSYVDSSIDIFGMVENEYAETGLTKEKILKVVCKNQNTYLMSQIPKLSKKYKLYILSNISPDYLISYFLKKYNIEKYFSGVVESCNIGYLKPSDEIYKYLLSEYKLDPKETIFFDDRQRNIDGAKKNGIHAILYDNFDTDIEKQIENTKL